MDCQGRAVEYACHTWWDHLRSRQYRYPNSYFREGVETADFGEVWEYAGRCPETAIDLRLHAFWHFSDSCY